MIFAVGGVVAYLLGEWLGRLVAWSRSRVLAAASSTVSVLLFSAFPPWLIFLLTYFVGARLAQLRSWAGLPVTGSVHGGPIVVVLAVGLLVALITGIALRGWARRNQRRALGLLAIPAGLAGFALGLVISGTWTDAVDQMLWPSALTAMLALILIAFGESMLVMRAGVSAEMAEDYVLTARAKALPERLIRDAHVAPNAVLPALSRLFTSVPYLLSGLVIIELSSETYALGWSFFYAIESGNVPVIIGIIAVVGVIGLVLRIALDIVQAIIDPRIIRASGESS
jgi:ABC-type dipeptide/oligopeptide/nickel transport system permease component